jgi:hypothetical protein
LVIKPLRSFERLAILRVYFVGDESFERTDVNRFIHQAAVAGCFAAMVADPAANPWEGIIHLNHPQGIFPTGFPDQGNITLGALTGRAGIPARRYAPFFDCVCVGNCLGIEFIDRPPILQAFVKFIGYDDRADFFTITAGNAFFSDDVARPVPQADIEIPHLAAQLQNIRISHDLDVWMAACFHQFRGDCAHRAIVGWEGLIQLGHFAADCRFCFHQVNLETLVCQV